MAVALVFCLASAAAAQFGRGFGFGFRSRFPPRFPKADTLREVATFVPEDRLLIETDAPFLAPVPHRGKRNEPAWVAETLYRLAALRSQATDELSARVAANFRAFIGSPR